MPWSTIHLHLPSSKYALTRSYQFGHYRSFRKVNKNTFFVKASYMNMEDLIDMRPKVLFRVHPKLSKKSKNTSLGSKLRELCIVQVDHFCKIAKSQMCSNLHFLLNGPKFLCLNWACDVIHDPWALPLVILLFLLFILILFHLNQIKSI